MATTSHLGITLLEQSQAQKEITINEALARIDAVLNVGAIDRDLATPPGSPADGDVYIVAASPTGAWSGKAGQVAYYDQVWRFIAPREGMLLWVNDENVHVCYSGSSWDLLSGGGGGGGGGSGSGSGSSSSGGGLVCEGRLTLTSNLPVTPSDVTAAGTVYFTPYKGNRLALYDGTGSWKVLSFSQLSISLASGFTSGKPYDVFAYDNSGSVALQAVAWTNDTTRATALALQDGIYVKSGAATHRYIGTFYTTGATTTEDSAAKRYVWNYSQRVTRSMASALETAASWNYSTPTWRQANANSANQMNFVVGVPEDMVRAQVPQITAYSSASTYRSVGVGIGLDSTSSNSATISTEGRCTLQVQALIQASFEDMVSAGRHYLAWIERCEGGDTQNFWPRLSSGYNVTRMTGTVLA